MSKHQLAVDTVVAKEEERMYKPILVTSRHQLAVDTVVACSDEPRERKEAGKRTKEPHERRGETGSQQYIYSSA